MISIIMSTYNENTEWVKKAIESILEQTYSDFEYIIVLDNPENCEIEKLVREYAQRDSKIKVIRNDVNLGLVASLNEAIKMAKGKYIMRMDADDISEKNRIEKELNYLKQNGFDLVARKSH